jgi:predicted small lipoprotein YifL
MKYLFILVLLLAVLACGIQDPLPLAPAATSIPVSNAAVIQIGPTHTEPVRMTVCNSGGLNIHTRPGQGEPLARKDPLPDGLIVSLTGNEFTPVLIPWYEVEVGLYLTGWVSSKYLCK